MISFQVLDALNAISATSSKTEKRRLLEPLASDPLGKLVLINAYNPYITFGITPPRVESEGKRHFDESSTSVWSTLSALSSRVITGGDAQQTVLELMLGLAPESAELLWRILSKDLRCGISEGSINKVSPGLIPVFEIMLAQPFDDNRPISWPVAIEPKLDGFRLSCPATVTSAELLSRTGRVFPSVSWMEPHITALMKALTKYLASDPFWDPYVRDGLLLDGEVLSGSFDQTAGDVRRKVKQARHAVFCLFDAVPLSAFKTGGPGLETPYAKRRELIDMIALVNREVGAPVEVVPSYLAGSMNEVMAFYDRFRSRGLEGAMLKNRDGHYHKKRAFDWMKIKPKETEDLVIVGAEEGTGKYVGMLGALIVRREHPAGSGNYVQVRVGSGFSDDERAQLWKDYQHDLALSPGTPPADYRLIGRMSEVEFHEITPDGSLRHPRHKRFRDDKMRPIGAAALSDAA